MTARARVLLLSATGAPGDDDQFRQHVLDELASLRRAVEQLQRPRLSRADRDVLGKLLPVIAATCGSTPFLARELVEHESPALRLVLTDMKTVPLGRLLLRAEDKAIDGLIVKGIKKENGTTVWCVEQVVGL